MNRLQRLFTEQQQSPWLDNLRRSYITSGALKGLMHEGIRGLTSNPSIFQKAIQESSDYDEQFASLIATGHDIESSYWQMVIQDIHGALDVFEPLFHESSGRDGFVSVEVSPLLAHDTQATITQARELWNTIDRHNVMIKVPATREGLPAIRRLISDGINVNVTLIFSLERYREVINCYVDGLADRMSAGLAIEGIASVASFFISRVDSEVDARLQALDTPAARSLMGKTAIAQAVLAYETFTTVFSGVEWGVYDTHGALVQRPLWASTSTKNPSYPDTLYVDRLVGPSSVNTLPEATLEAFVDHGTVARTIDVDTDAAHRIWDQLSEVGIDMDDVSRRLEAEGVAAFAKSFDDLLQALVTKAEELRA